MKRAFNGNLSRQLKIVPLLIALLAAGCGPKPTGEVSGLVTYNGEPLPSGIVAFVGDDESNKEKVETGGIGPDGKYRVQRLLCGKVRITVQTPPIVTGPFAGASVPSIEIPKKYAELTESGLTHTVTVGPQTFDIKLTGPALGRTGVGAGSPKLEDTLEMKQRLKGKRSP